MKPIAFATLYLIALQHFLIISVSAQGSAFTYQGSIHASGVPANGSYDLRFSLHDSLQAGIQLGGSLTNSATAVTNGLFLASLDFGGGIFTNAPRWLEIALRTNSDNPFIVLSPRQKLTPTPYSIYSADAGNARNLTGTLSAGQLSGTLPLSLLPAIVITNNATGVNLVGNFSGAFTSNGALLTNHPSGVSSNAVVGLINTLAPYIFPAGTPKHVNLSRLTRFRNTLLNSNRPIRIFITTDQLTGSDGTAWPVNAIDPLKRLLNKEGGFMPGGSFAGDFVFDFNAHVWQIPTPDQPGIFLGTESYLNLTNGGSVTFHRSGGAGTGVADTNVYSDTFALLYLKEPRAGVFTIETNTSGSGWNVCRTIVATAAGTNMGVTNITFDLGYRSVRIVHGNDNTTNRIKTASLYNSKTNALLIGGVLVNQGGQLYQFVTQCSDSVSAPFWRAMNPDLIILQDFAETNNIGALDVLEASWATNCPNADVLLIGQFFNEGSQVGTANDYLAYNTGMREKALQYGRAYFDSAFYLPDHATITEWTNRGWVWPDGIHLYKEGIKILNEAVWRDVFDATLFNPAFDIPDNFTGPGARFLNGYLGTVYSVTNAGPFQVTAAGGPTLTVTRADANTIQVFLNNPKSYLAGTATGAVFVRGTNHLYLQARNDSTVAVDIFPGGGIVLGGGGGIDPGEGNARVVGNLTLGGTFMGNGSGLTSLSPDALVGGMTTNIAVLSGARTNLLCFTNGILRAVR